MFLEAVCTLEVCLVTVRHIMVPCASFAAGGVEACDPDVVVSATLETLERSGRCWVDGGADVRQVDVFRERVPSKGEEEGAPTSVCLDYVLGGPDVGMRSAADPSMSTPLMTPVILLVSLDASWEVTAMPLRVVMFKGPVGCCCW